MFTIVMDVEINSTAGVTSVEQESNTIVNSLPVETEAYVDSLSISDLQPYPGYSGDIVVTGFGEHMGVAGYPDDSLRLFAILTGLPPSSTGDVRVHEGYTCETSGPRFLSPTTGEDPWIHASYTSDEFGRAEVNVVGYNSSLVSVVGRAFVVYDPDGSRVSCGIISGESPGEDKASINAAFRGRGDVGVWAKN